MCVIWRKQEEVIWMWNTTTWVQQKSGKSTRVISSAVLAGMHSNVVIKSVSVACWDTAPALIIYMGPGEWDSNNILTQECCFTAEQTNPKTLHVGWSVLWSHVLWLCAEAVWVLSVLLSCVMSVLLGHNNVTSDLSWHGFVPILHVCYSCVHEERLISPQPDTSGIEGGLWF